MSATAEPDFSDLVEGVISPIPLNRLMLSSLNVRQTERAADVDSLAEDIASRGLKQNLVVVPAHFTSGEASELQRQSCKPAPGGTGPWAGRFEVIAGGRRFQAMQLLVQQERLSPTYPVPCMIEFRDEAAETSLSENLHRVAMNPADEFEAYRVIVDRATKQGLDPDPVAYCAKRFGVTVKHVNGRLRLATLAPEILDALRANEIGVDSAKAYAGTEDHALQLEVFAAQKKSSWQPHSPSSVRDALRGKSLSLNDGLVKFVTLDAYVAAGGRVEAEMFMGTDGEQRVMDLKLLAKMGQEKAEPMVGPQAKKDGFQSGLLAVGVGQQAKWPKAPAGMERFIKYYGEKEPTKAELKKSVAVYAIDWNGDGISKIGHFHAPKPKKQDQGSNWEAEQKERARFHAIEMRAARMAVYDLGSFKGTPLEGNAFWPNGYSARTLEPDTDENFDLVAVLIRVPHASIEGHKAEAERLIDEEQAAAQRTALVEELRAERIAAEEAAAQEQGA